MRGGGPPTYMFPEFADYHKKKTTKETIHFIVLPTNISSFPMITNQGTSNQSKAIDFWETQKLLHHCSSPRDHSKKGWSFSQCHNWYIHPRLTNILISFQVETTTAKVNGWKLILVNRILMKYQRRTLETSQSQIPHAHRMLVGQCKAYMWFRRGSR